MSYEPDKQNLQNPRSYKLFGRWLALIFASIAMLILIWTIGFSFWLSAGNLKSSLDPEYIPTAEYLLENPYEESPTNFDEFHIQLNNFESDSQSICFTILESTNQDFERASYVEILVNEQLAARITMRDEPILTISPTQSQFCISGTLDTGLHIIEAKAYSDIFSEPNYIHRWAIDVK